MFYTCSTVVIGVDIGSITIGIVLTVVTVPLSYFSDVELEGEIKRY